MDCDASQKAEKLEQQEKLIQQQAETIRKQHELIEKLKQDLHLLRRYTFGRKRERFAEAALEQILLFELQTEAGAAADVGSSEDNNGAGGVPEPKKGHGRRKLPAHLPRKQIRHTIEGDALLCPCCNLARVKIGEEVTEQLEVVPASVVVLEHIQDVVACVNKACQASNVQTAPKPRQPIEKGLPGPALLAQVVTFKMADHLPLYRQEDVLARNGVHIRRSTLCGWMARCAILVLPLYLLMLRRVLRSKVLGLDDTTVDVRDPSLNRTRQAYFWQYYGDDANPYVCFDFSTSRARAGPEKILQDFRGIVQGDAYWEDITSVLPNLACFAGCMAHARRYFERARDKSPTVDVHSALTYIQRLYDVEDEVRDMTAEQRLALRQEKSVPILSAFKQWLDTPRPSLIPSNPLAEAITYATNQWESLLVYTKDGSVPIDNNRVEGMMRHPVIGRNNWLFVGSDNGGRTAAVLYSLIITCKRLRIDPRAYLQDVFTRLPSARTLALRQLLPDRWIKRYPQHRLLHREQEAKAAAERKRIRREGRRQKRAAAALADQPA